MTEEEKLYAIQEIKRLYPIHDIMDFASLTPDQELRLLQVQCALAEIGITQDYFRLIRTERQLTEEGFTTNFPQLIAKAAAENKIHLNQDESYSFGLPMEWRHDSRTGNHYFHVKPKHMTELANMLETVI